MTGINLERVTEEPVEAPKAGSSALAKIRRLYQQAEEDLYLDLPIPRNPIMGVRYEAVQDFHSTGKTDGEQHQDFLIAACRSIIVRDGKEWEPLTQDGEPVRFDEALSDILDLGVPSLEDGGTARDVVLKVFGRAPRPDLAIAAHVDRVSNWMAGDQSDLDTEAVLGES